MKRILSLILATVMMISLLPVTVLFSSAAGESEYTYSFIPADYKAGELVANGLPNYTSYTSDTYTEGERNWIYHAMTDAAYSNWETYRDADPSRDGRGVCGFDTGGLNFSPKEVNGWVTLKFRVPEAGLYKLSYVSVQNETNKTYNSKAYISIIPGSYTKADIINLGTLQTRYSIFLMATGVNFSNANVAAEVRPAGTSVFAAETDNEEFLIAFTAGDTNLIRLRGFKITKVSDEIDLTADEVILAEGGEVSTITASLKNNTLLRCLGPEYSVADTNVATVNASGRITPVSAGWTTFTARIGDATKTIAVGVKDSSGSVPGEKPDTEPELSFPYEFIHKGESVKIINANSSYSFTSTNTAVATVSEDGTLTALKPGKTTVTATKGEIVKTFEIPVVGENLINRNGIDHGHFENGIAFSDKSDPLAQSDDRSFWEAGRRSDTTAVDYKTFIYGWKYENIALPGRTDKVKAVRFSFEDGEPADRNKVVVQAPKSVTKYQSDNSGLIIAEENKMYEFSGWYSAQNTEFLGDLWHMLTLYNCAGSTYTEIGGLNIKPWDGKSGDQAWQMLTLPPVVIDSKGSTQVGMRPAFQSASATKIGDILVTELSLHEVVYDRMELAEKEATFAAGEIYTVSAKHYSNTGNAIREFNESNKTQDAEVELKCESLNNDVVRAMDSGKLIGVGNGTATVKVTATICGVSQTEEMEITVSGGERPEFIGSVELAIQGENIYPASFARATLTVKNENGEPMTLNSDEITYESSDTEVATVTSNGVIRAKTAGEATITVKAKRFGLEKTASVNITVLPLPAETEFPEVIGAYFTTDHTYVGGENSIIVTDIHGRKLGGGVTYAYEIDDDSVISESNGTFTGHKIGRTIVTVSATLDGVTRYTEVPAVVVGSNLLIRMGVNHGELENGIYFNDKSSDTIQYSSFWTAAHNNNREVFTYELLRNQFSEILGAPASPTNIAKFTMPGGTTPSGAKLIRINGAKEGYKPDTGRHTGLITVDPGKLYEFTGYIKTENTVTLPENACGTLGYHSGADSSATELRVFKSSPWQGKNGDQPWSKFNVSPVLINWRSLKTCTVSPGVDALSGDDNEGYELYLAHMSFHEVVFNDVAFSYSGDFSTAKTYDTFKTVAYPVSNTGAQIVSGNETTSIEVTYRSDDEGVARISKDGTITAVSDGTTKVYASATILGETKTAELTVSFSGLDVTFDRVEASVPSEMNVGDEIIAPARLLNTDGSVYAGTGEIYWESENGAVVSVSQDGKITAKKSGETVINIYAMVGERIVSTSYNVKVYDVTPLDKAVISGENTVEAGFKITLSVSATHESGSAADMTDCVVKFELCNPATEDILTVSEDGVVTGAAEGTASVKATVTAPDGSTATSEAFEITVTPKSPKSKFFDFRIYPVKTSPIGSVSLDKDGWTVNEGLSAPGLISGPLGDFHFLRTGLIAKVPANGYLLNADTTLDIKVDYDGWYELDFMGAQQTNGAYLAYLYMDGKYMGRYVFQGFEILEGPVLEMNTMYLEAGTHQFTIRTVDGETHKRTQHFGYLSLKYLTETPTLNDPEFLVEQTSLAVGESIEAPVKVTMSNGRVHNFGLLHGERADTESNLTVISSDSAVAEYKNNRIIAKAEGNATITAKVLVYKTPAETPLYINVTDEKLSRVESIKSEGIKLYVGDTADIELRAFVKGSESAEREVAVENLSFSYELLGDDVADVADGKITAKAVGNATLKIMAKLGNADPITAYIPVTVLTDGYASVALDAVSQVLKFGDDQGTVLVIKAYDNFGKEIVSTNAEVVYTVSGEADTITVDENGRVLPVNIGVATVKADVIIDGITHTTNEITISVRNGKVGATYYTDEHIAAARENVRKYDWAKSEMETAVENADKYLQSLERVYDMITSHDLYRLTMFTDEKIALPNGEPLAYYCPYCGVNVVEKYGNGNKWKIDMLTRPWKVQCAECKRLFPSNDFASFYELGLDEHHEFSRQLALENNGIKCGRGERNENGEYVPHPQFADNPYGYGDKNGFLWNETYTELYADGLDPWKRTPITQGWIPEETAKEMGLGYFWGVDDGKGYNTGIRHNQTTADPNGILETYTFVGVANYAGIWYYHGRPHWPVVYAALTAFRDAYLYTGDKKYGIAGAIILDRVADVYPDMDYNIDCLGHFSLGTVGKVSGSIHENFVNRLYTTAYDAFFDCYDEPEVITFLSGKAKEWKLDNKKTHGELIRQNIEEGILVETYNACRELKIHGNFGFSQYTLPLAAVILDREPLTEEMIDFTMRAGERSVTMDVDTEEGQRIEYELTGLGLYSGIMNQIDRDGYGNESSLPYNGIFTNNFATIVDLFARYKKVNPKYDLSKNPKVINSYTLGADTILAGIREPNISDASENWGRIGVADQSAIWKMGMQSTDNPDPIFAQLLYFKNGNSAEGLKYDIFTKDPESLEKEVEAIIAEHGEIELSKSGITTGYGLAVLRDGVLYNDVTSGTKANTMRDWWMYFGHGMTNHKHMDALNLGLDAFGLNFSPDHGYYPSDGTNETRRVQWNFGTTSHNTVVVDDKSQTKLGIHSYPLHFEDSGRVKVMDVDAKNAYDVTDIYRRTVVSVDIDDTVSYALDFFRIKGGDEHVYSFHSQSEESVVSGVNMVKQPHGTYAGINVPFGDLTYDKDCGYNWMPNVSRAVYPETGEFSIDFKVKDYRKTIPGNRNFHLKLTQLNGFDISEVATADGTCIPVEGNPEYQDYLLVRRSGKNLDTLFTSVIEPYADSSKIKSLARVDVVRKDGGEIRESDAVAAVRVELHNGRVDYVVYSAKNDVEYRVADLFDFTGFVGVYSVNAADSTDVVSTYINDGTKIGDVTAERAAVTGEVVDFTDYLNYEDGEPVLDNFLEITAPAGIASESLVGKMIVVDNDGGRNGAYVIKSAEVKGDNILLGTGDVNFFRSLAEDNETFVWNIERGQSYRIPMSVYEDEAPEISVSGTFTTSAESSIKIPLNITSDREYTLIGTSLPRGMSLNEETGILTWKPDSSQVGENHVAVTVDNGVLSDTVHFTITVYGSTTSKPSDTTDNTETPSTGTSVEGGSGGGGGGAAPDTGDSSNEDEGEEIPDIPQDGTDESTQPDVGNGVYDVPQFTDLTNHSWAADAINALAVDGIIRGTSGTTFSPEANITRADFALLLVRAFRLESENAENFADVSASDYFATELAIARNNGIVGGIGENKYAPRNNITRQDMIVIVYRALQKQDVGFGIYDEPKYEDFDAVAEYAKEAVSALIGAGLVNGKNNLIAPMDYTTRAEVAVLINRILDYTK